MIWKNAKILITGANGLLGCGILNALENRKVNGLEIFTPNHSEMDCLDFNSVKDFFNRTKPDYVFHLAACVYGLGGNMENQLKALFLNTLMTSNVLTNSINHNVKKIFYAGSVAEYGYPYKSLPLKEEDLFIGTPHFGEYGYAMAKRHAQAYLELGEKINAVSYVKGLFTNMYGINDRFNLKNGHVVPSLLLKAERANSDKVFLHVWGDGNTTRDFMFNLDAGEAVLKVFETSEGNVNIASGIETDMYTLVETIAANYPDIKGVIWEKNKPKGILRRSVDTGCLTKLGYKTKYSLKDGIAKTVEWMNGNVVRRS